MSDPLNGRPIDGPGYPSWNTAVELDGTPGAMVPAGDCGAAGCG